MSPEVARREEGGGDRGTVILDAAVGVATSSQAATGVLAAVAASVIRGGERSMGRQSVVAMMRQGSER